VDDQGNQTTDVPETILDNGAKTATTYSVYAQDEWKLLPNLTLNYGLRFDEFEGFRSENQVSPRVNLVWDATGATTVHIGYSRFFTPPPFELIANTTVTKFAGTTGAPPGTQDTTPFAERANYYDGGISQKVIPGLTVGLDIYYKDAQHLIDEGQFGAPIILTPFNYEVGKVYGAELSASYSHRAFTAYANLAYSHAQGKNIITSEFNFDPGDLAYIQDHFIFLDHDQRWTGNLGASYAFPTDTHAGFDLIYGTGLRQDSDVPNGGQLQSYIQVNLSLSQQLDKLVPGGPMEVRFDVINLFDNVYQIRNGTGVGVGAPQFGPRRGFFVGLKKSF
jgi:outer membrane receptor protein involved in Fe transport